MGADFLLAATKYPTYTDGGLVDWSDIQDLARRRTGALTAKQLGGRDAMVRILDEWDYDWVATWLDSDDPATEEINSRDDVDDWDSDKATILELLMAVGWFLDRAVETIIEGRRECVGFALEADQPTYLYSGGMSYGDGPTEAYDAIGIVDSVHLFDEPFPLTPKED